MQNDLAEIRDELEYVLARKRKQVGVEWWKTVIQFSVSSIAGFNDYYSDPFELELSEWAKDVTYEPCF